MEVKRRLCEIIGTFFTLSTLIVMGTSCGQVKSASAERQPLTVSPLQTYPKKSTLLKNNQLFLWPATVSSDQMAEVFEIGDRLNQYQRDTVPMRQRLKELENASPPEVGKNKDLISAKYLDVSRFEIRIGKLKGNLKVVGGRLDKAKKTLEEAKVKAKPEDENVKKLASVVATDETKKASFEKEQVDLENQKSVILKEIADLKDQNEKLEKSILQEKADLSQKIKVIEQKSLQDMAQVIQIVTWYDTSNMQVYFGVGGDGTLSASITNWVIDGQQRNFSTTPIDGTSKPTVENLKYTELGGIFEFDVLDYDDAAQNHLKRRFSFKVSRNRCGLAENRVCYSGDLLSTVYLSNGAAQSSAGVAKLIDNPT